MCWHANKESVGMSVPEDGHFLFRISIHQRCSFILASYSPRDHVRLWTNIDIAANTLTFASSRILSAYTFCLRSL